MVTSLDKTAGDVLKLLSRLDEQIIARRHPNWDAFAGVARPNIQARIARSSVNGQEVQICVEAGQDGVLLAILLQIRRCRCQEVRPANDSAKYQTGQ